MNAWKNCTWLRDTGLVVEFEALDLPTLRESTAMLVFLVVATMICSCQVSDVGPGVESSALECRSSSRCDLEFCDQVLIAGGTFVMGDDLSHPGATPDDFGGLSFFGNSTPAHVVDVGPFCMDQFEVTVERYELCVQAGACDPGGVECLRLENPNSYWTEVNHYPEACKNRGELCPVYPVNCKSRRQARAYCQWIGRRLCTESEWERAAKGPDPFGRTYPWGDEEPTGSVANTCYDGPGYLMPVDSYPLGVSAEGVFNLAGNVYEWVSEDYKEYLLGQRGSSNTLGSSTGLMLGVARGGCFATESDYSCTERTTMDPAFNWGCIGIRCCSDAVSARPASRPMVASPQSPPGAWPSSWP